MALWAKIQYCGMMFFLSFSLLSKCIGKAIKLQKNVKLKRKFKVPSLKPKFKKIKNYRWISFLMYINAANSCLTITLKSHFNICIRIFQTNIFLFVTGNSKIHFWHFGQTYNFGDFFYF